MDESIIMTKKLYLPFLFLALAVGIGAFGAHALESKLSPKYMETYDTANFYHFVHGLGWAISLFILSSIKSNKINMIHWLFLSGIILFSGSLYLLSFSEFLNIPKLKFLGAIAPIGGLSFIGAWVFTAWEIYSQKDAITSIM